MTDSSRNRGCVILMAKVVKQLLLFLLAVQLAAPAGSCCWSTGQRSPQRNLVAGRACCAASGQCTPRETPPARTDCCCPKIAIRPVPFDSGLTVDWAAGMAVPPGSHDLLRQIDSRARVTRHETGPECARHVLFCVWNC
ncbi:MAG: hypothetical protein EHM42_11890 [Planctomycetaceae bacterium]|nr:MAG: hypothetical protein EHM42_11890 [Planctomycetaceae bacterium]